ncbi:50S ribosomal protein L1 [Salinisphaera orenii MK-B5]|uniref:Large ribosomal subunit protein uL1 n=2 Tax=Salinisphaera orenii TaxID=856731 RepID=A0A423PK06_9GAMM|nr:MULTISPECIES: 50S ribosomal protein L1 [Salinisphaera]ROO23757.1 50S ribosomal protein L1 [Salinisphaera halophila YIM 95161]ROO25913.1 50S ribosomal protein L1 [Salinisphaera orenii MK-B5]
MAKLSKRKAAIRDQIDPFRLYPVDEALDVLKKVSSAKFTESVEVAVNLGVNARKSDQNVRGSTVMPHGTGKSVRVAVFTQGDNADKAIAAGADVVGLNDLAEQVQAGEINFDMVVATPDAMPVVGRLGQILGPKGLMPNPKTGTVTADVETAVKNAKAGQVQYRTDKAGIIHCAIGKTDFDNAALRENLAALIADLKKAKPANAKGIYLRKISLSTTMGPGLAVDASGVAA